MARIDKELKRAGESAKTLHQKAQLLYHQGKIQEARVLFERASTDPSQAKEAVNNLGNLQLVSGEASAALVTYKKAAAIDDQDPRSTSTPRWRHSPSGDEDAFGEHIFMSIDLGAEDAVNRLSQSGVMATSGTTGSDAQGLAMRELKGRSRRPLSAPESASKRRLRPSRVTLPRRPSPSTATSTGSETRSTALRLLNRSLTTALSLLVTLTLSSSALAEAKEEARKPPLLKVGQIAPSFLLKAMNPKLGASRSCRPRSSRAQPPPIDEAPSS